MVDLDLLTKADKELLSKVTEKKNMTGALLL